MNTIGKEQERNEVIIDLNKVLLCMLGLVGSARLGLVIL